MIAALLIAVWSFIVLKVRKSTLLKAIMARLMKSEYPQGEKMKVEQ
ncbi:hypothetical protein [Chitinophaga ginsengisoli]|uniref:Uncharacterized protein n=1 Tax=Chitinophaga ginsengisoli TaxID=363837 RepID=A0A2P8FIG4_9BACT|nr:hypothetical protein [Chitinophaga ginsengisoli]PSL21496.1 hypothetical protein CLV42_12350 [Chitinophaga ginsengisoli]